MKNLYGHIGNIFGYTTAGLAVYYLICAIISKFELAYSFILIILGLQLLCLLLQSIFYKLNKNKGE